MDKTYTSKSDALAALFLLPSKVTNWHLRSHASVKKAAALQGIVVKGYSKVLLIELLMYKEIDRIRGGFEGLKNIQTAQNGPSWAQGHPDQELL